MWEELATLSVLVLAIWTAIGKDQRIGPFFADGPGKDRKCALGNERAHDANRKLEPAVPICCRNAQLPGTSRSLLSLVELLHKGTD